MNELEYAEHLLAQLNLDEKIELLSGADIWHTASNQKIGLRQMLLSDGPSGVRGEFDDERDNSLNLPSGTSLGSTWSPSIVAEYGRQLAMEAARKGVDVVLGPTINLHRSPLGGRHFESLSEDPYLTGALAVAYTRSIQASGKAACPKHYVCNDFETDRFNVDVRVDAKTLNEVYLRPFEDVALKASPWSLMSSYNSVNGTTMSENALLNNPLRTEWKFDGVVVSDWEAVRAVTSANAEQDLAMPGPRTPWSVELSNAVRIGTVAESTIDRKVIRLLVLAQRVGALEKSGKIPLMPPKHNEIPASSVSFARKAVSSGAVLLKNDGVLPLDFAKLNNLAVLGHNARAARTMGGGSSTVHPKTCVSPLEALRKSLGDRVSYSIGAVVQLGIEPVLPSQLSHPTRDEPGVHVEFFNHDGKVIFEEVRLLSNPRWLGSKAPVAKAAAMRLRTKFTPNESGSKLFGFASVQQVTMKLNGSDFISTQLEFLGENPILAIFEPPHISKPFTFEAGKSVDVDIWVDLTGREDSNLAHILSFSFGYEDDPSKGDELIAQAVETAKNAEVAIVVVGTNDRVESEGFDRKSLRLPGRQDELVSAIAAVNSNLVVIVNSGAPVEMPWRDATRAILLTYFGGQEMGNGLVDMLSGAVEPGGRLPTTWGETLAQTPVTNCEPRQPENQVAYDEGIHIGYRAWLRAEKKPAFEFGFGLGYTSWSLSAPQVPARVCVGEEFKVTVDATNIGERSGRHVIQVYASRQISAVERPALWLVGFAEIEADAQESRSVEVSLSSRDFAHWQDGWAYEPGNFDLHIGSSVEKIDHSVSFELIDSQQ